MGKINVLFFSAVPLTIQSIEEYFRHDDVIILTAVYFNNRPVLDDNIVFDNDVIILDDGALNEIEIDKIKKLVKEKELNKKCILLTSMLDKCYLDFYLAEGIDGILSKKDELETIKEGILRAYQGNRFLSSRIQELYKSQIKKISLNSSDGQLTSREKEIFMYVGRGCSNKEIADRLFVDVKTIEKHKSNIMKKLNLKNASQLFLYAALQILDFCLIFLNTLHEDIF